MSGFFLLKPYKVGIKAVARVIILRLDIKVFNLYPYTFILQVVSALMQLE